MTIGTAPDGEQVAKETAGNGCVLFLTIRQLTGTKRTTKYPRQHLDSAHGPSNREYTRYVQIFSGWSAAFRFQTKSISTVERNNKSLLSSDGSAEEMEDSFLFQRTKRTEQWLQRLHRPISYKG